MHILRTVFVSIQIIREKKKSEHVHIKHCQTVFLMLLLINNSIRRGVGTINLNENPRLGRLGSTSKLRLKLHGLVQTDWRCSLVMSHYIESAVERSVLTTRKVASHSPYSREIFHFLEEGFPIREKFSQFWGFSLKREVFLRRFSTILGFFRYFGFCYPNLNFFLLFCYFSLLLQYYIWTNNWHVRRKKDVPYKKELPLNNASPTKIRHKHCKFIH